MAVRFVLYALPLLLASTSTVLAMNQNCADLDIITVRGMGRRSVKASIAVITLGIESSGKTNKMVQRDLAQRARRLVGFLRTQRVSKLETSGVSLFPEFNFRVTPRVLVGFRGSNTVSFQVAVSRAGVVLDGAVKNGATRINGVSFKASPKASRLARNRALRDAVRTARREAKIVAAAAGNSLGRALAVRVTDSFFPQSVRSNMSFRGAMRSRSRATTPILGRDIVVSARVEIKYDSIY